VEQNDRLRKLMGTLIHWAESEEKEEKKPFKNLV
jgi:hypothetical protein